MSRDHELEFGGDAGLENARNYIVLQASDRLILRPIEYWLLRRFSVWHQPAPI
jgi:hypothetical protein